MLRPPDFVITIPRTLQLEMTEAIANNRKVDSVFKKKRDENHRCRVHLILSTVVRTYRVWRCTSHGASRSKLLCSAGCEAWVSCR